MMHVLLAFWVAFPLSDVAGDSTCPLPSRVRQRLAAMANEIQGGSDPAAHRAYLSSRAIASPASNAEWTRAALVPGPSYRLGRAGPGIGLHAGGVLALLRTRGVGLPRNASDTNLQLGFGAGLRGLLPWNNAAGWLGADVLVYPGDDRLTIGNHGDVGRLPRLEITLALGISLGQFQ